MPTPVGVEQAVGKMLRRAPAAAAAKENPEPQAPASDTPAKQPEPSQAPAAKQDAATENEQPSSFEQELIQEYQEEYSQLPEGQRKPFLDALKRTYRKQAKQMTELGNLRKAVSALKDAGVTNDDILALINQKKSGRAAAPTANGNGTETRRGFRRWETEASTPEDRENLTKAEQVVRELVEDMLAERLEKEVKPLRDRIELEDSRLREERSKTLTKEINDLEDVQGFKGSLIETYREQIMELGLRNPRWSARKLLNIVAEPDEIETGRVAKSDNGQKQRVPAASAVNKSTTQQVDLPRKRSGTISVTQAIDKILRGKRI